MRQTATDRHHRRNDPRPNRTPGRHAGPRTRTGAPPAAMGSQTARHRAVPVHPSPLPLVACTLLVLLVLPAHAGAQDAWSFDPPVQVAQDLRNPVDIAFGRDGYVYYASLPDREVRRISIESGEPDAGFVVVVENATWQRSTETGLYSMAMHPDFASNGQFYVSYSHNESGEWRNVLSRMTLQDASGAATEEVLLTRAGNIFHNGGRLLVADDHLYWTTGDAANPFTHDPLVAGQVAQEDGVMRGKILRLTLDGEPAEDNPWNDAAYTKGHRNVYGIAWDPEQDRLLATENGNARRDYINLLEAGGNYGWPECEGACDEERPEYIDPIWQSEGTVAPTGITWFRGAFWFGTFNQGDLMRLSDRDGEWAIEKVHHDTHERNPRILDVAVGPDGESLWFSTWYEVWRVDFAEDERYPPVAALAEGPFWWNGTTTGERADPGAGNPGRDIPGAGGLALFVLALAVAWARRGARRP